MKKILLLFVIMLFIKCSNTPVGVNISDWSYNTGNKITNIRLYKNETDFSIINSQGFFLLKEGNYTIKWNCNNLEIINEIKVPEYSTENSYLNFYIYGDKLLTNFDEISKIDSIVKSEMK